MTRVLIESPYAGDVAANIEYALRCMRDCFNRGEAPFASHLFYTQALNDVDAKQRQTGIAAGFAWGKVADKTVVYCDKGISSGMFQGVEAAIAAGRVIEVRSLERSWDKITEAEFAIGKVRANFRAMPTPL